MFKKKLFLFGIIITVCTVAFSSLTVDFFANKYFETDASTYVLELNAEKRINSSTTSTSGASTVLTSEGNEIGFAYENISIGDGFQNIYSNGKIRNTSALNGIVGINISSKQEGFALYYGFEGDEVIHTAIENNVTIDTNIYQYSYVFQNNPSYFKIINPTEEVVELISVKISYTCIKDNSGNLPLISPNGYQDTHKYGDKEFIDDFPMYSESEWTNTLRFDLSSDGTYYIVSDFLGEDRLLNSDTLIIPAYHNGLPVEEIKQAAEGIGAFSELTWLKNVYLPKTIKRIGYGTFSLSCLENLYIDCENLENFEGRNWVFYPPQFKEYTGMNVYFGPNVKRIPDRLFYPNVTEPSFIPKITNIYFSKDCKIESIGKHAFHNVNAFDKISLPDSIKTIDEFAFYNTSIKEIVLPNSLTYIGNDAFEFSQIEHVKVNNSLSFIGDRAFAYTNLKNIDLTNTSITKINDEAFAYTESLRKLSLPNSLQIIGQRSFKNSAIVDLIIPNSTQIIGIDAFNSATNLERVKLGSGLKTIKKGAFAYTSNLLAIQVDSIKLDDISTGNNIFVEAGKNNGMQVYFSKGVTHIPSYMFFPTSNVDKLPNIIVLSLPNTLSTIGAGAFMESDIARVNFRGTRSEFESINIVDGYVFTNLDFGGVKYE